MSHVLLATESELPARRQLDPSAGVRSETERHEARRHLRASGCQTARLATKPKTAHGQQQAKTKPPPVPPRRRSARAREGDRAGERKRTICEPFWLENHLAIAISRGSHYYPNPHLTRVFAVELLGKQVKRETDRCHVSHHACLADMRSEEVTVWMAFSMRPSMGGNSRPLAVCFVSTIDDERETHGPRDDHPVRQRSQWETD